MITDKKQLIRYTLITTFIIGLLSHGYCYFNLLFSHDSMPVNQDDVLWQVSLGRFLHPLYFKIRGPIYAPALVGFLSLFFMAVAFYLIFQLFDITKKLTIWILCGILITNTSITLLNATYIHDIDMYTLSLLLAVAAVYLCRNFRFGIIWGMLCLCASLGLYQSFMQVSIFLFMILAVMDILHKKTFWEVLKKGLLGIAMILGGLILYSIGVKVMIHLYDISLSAGYNGISTVGQYDSLSSIWKYIKGTYLYVWKCFFKPTIFNRSLIRIVNLILLGATILFLFVLSISRKIKKENLLLLIILLILMPFGSNVIYFISKGEEHRLMIYSLFLAYVFAELVFEEFCTLPVVEKFLATAQNRLKTMISVSVPALIALVIFYSIVFANQAYLKKDLELKNTMLTLNRVVDRIEQTKGYVMGETPVVIVGTLMESDLAKKRPGLKLPGTGLNSVFSVTDTTTYLEYFNNFLSYPIKLGNAYTSAQWAQKEEVQNMPAFPAAGSCQFIDGTLVVKLS